MTPSIKRLIELDIFRGIAIVSIILYHFTYSFNYLYGNLVDAVLLFRWGYLGVQLFFILGGFSVGYSLKNAVTPFNFLIDRFTRLFPSYWVSIIIIYLITSQFFLPGRSVTFSHFLVNFTMLQHWLGIPDVDGAYWILPVFLVFYFFIMIVLFLKKIAHLKLIGLFWIILGLIIWKLPVFNQSIFQSFFLFFKYAHLFVAGIMFWEIFFKKANKFTHWLIFISFGAQLMLFNFIESLAVLAFYLLMYLFSYKKLSLPPFLKIFSYLGLISFQIYLIHQNIGYIIMLQLVKFDLPLIIIVTIPIIVTFCLAGIIYRFIEIPIKRIIRSRFF